MKFKVGDKVKIKHSKWLNENRGILFNGCEITDKMVCLSGVIVQISECLTNTYRIKELSAHQWTDEMFEDCVINEQQPRSQRQFQSGMKRNDSTGKPRFDLICPLSQEYDKTLLYRWAMLLTKGMKIYSARNWEQANGLEELESFKASAERHFRQAMAGDTTEDHFAAILFNLNGIVYLMDKLKCDVKGNTNEN